MGKVSFVDAGSVVLHFEFQAAFDATAAQNDAAFRRRIRAAFSMRWRKTRPSKPGVEPGRAIGLLNHERLPGAVPEQLRTLQQLLEQRSSMPGRRLNANDIGIDLRHLHGFANQCVETR